MRNLGIDADMVPIVYRVRVTTRDGEVMETTTMVRVSEVDATKTRLRDALSGVSGLEDATIDVWPA